VRKITARLAQAPTAPGDRGFHRLRPSSLGEADAARPCALALTTAIDVNETDPCAPLMN
jgi:hypothetical protein